MPKPENQLEIIGKKLEIVERNLEASVCAEVEEKAEHYVDICSDLDGVLASNAAPNEESYLVIDQIGETSEDGDENLTTDPPTKCARTGEQGQTKKEPEQQFEHEEFDE